MAINFYQEKFDSQILKRKVYKLILKEEVTAEDFSCLLNKGKSAGCEIIFCFSIFLNQNIQLLKKHGFSFISSKNCYKLSPEYCGRKTAKLEGFDFVARSQHLPNLCEDDIRNMAKVIGAKSRYFLDRNIKADKSLRIYTEWIRNSIYNEYADEAFFLTKKKKLAGLITLKIRDKKGYIDLIGIDQSCQGIGLGTALLQAGVEYFRKNYVSDILVYTQGENIKANRFYQTNGFIIEGCMDLVYHKHFI